jgi:hypothetical protein
VSPLPRTIEVPRANHAQTTVGAPLLPARDRGPSGLRLPGCARRWPSRTHRPNSATGPAAPHGHLDRSAFDSEYPLTEGTRGCEHCGMDFQPVEGLLLT